MFVNYGFPIGHDNCAIPIPAVENHSSATCHPSHVDKYINTELTHKALLGPFDNPPFSWTMVSPLMTREKAGSEECRVIMDLSFPDGGIIHC